MWLLNELNKYSNVESTAVIYRESNIAYKDLWNKSENLACFINDNLQTKNPIVIYEIKISILR